MYGYINIKEKKHYILKQAKDLNIAVKIVLKKRINEKGYRFNESGLRSYLNQWIREHNAYTGNENSIEEALNFICEIESSLLPIITYKRKKVLISEVEKEVKEVFKTMLHKIV